MLQEEFDRSYKDIVVAGAPEPVPEGAESSSSGAKRAGKQKRNTTVSSVAGVPEVRPCCLWSVHATDSS